MINETKQNFMEQEKLQLIQCSLKYIHIIFSVFTFFSFLYIIDSNNSVLVPLILQYDS